MNSKKKKNIVRGIIIVAICAVILSICCAGCSSCDRMWKDVGSDISGGLDRIVTIYNFDGEVMKIFNGKIDLEPNDSGVVKFELDGKRYMYYNAIVEVIEK